MFTRPIQNATKYREFVPEPAATVRTYENKYHISNLAIDQDGTFLIKFVMACSSRTRTSTSISASSWQSWNVPRKISTQTSPVRNRRARRWRVITRPRAREEIRRRSRISPEKRGVEATYFPSKMEAKWPWWQDEQVKILKMSHFRCALGFHEGLQTHLYCKTHSQKRYSMGKRGIRSSPNYY